MPIINGKWIAPSGLIKEMGFEEFAKLYPPTGLKHHTHHRPEREEEEVTNIIDAREGFTFGCDPEGFVFNIETNKPVPAGNVGILGTKAEPHPLYDDKGELIGYSQVDGMAAEFNIPTVTNFRDWNRHIDGTIKALSAQLEPGHEIRFIPSVVFDKEVFDAADEKAKELGCSPDYNAWEGQVNPPPSCPDNPYLRTGSGHLHIGWTKGAEVSDPQHLVNCTDLVKQYDFILGYWSLKHDPDPVRRSLYGQAGACRIKDYGVEYRVLSNFWVTTRERRLMVWNRMMVGIRDMTSRFLPEKASVYNHRVVEAINVSKRDTFLERECRYPLVSLAR